MQEKEESILTIPPEKLTPGMRQYQDAKRANPDCVVMLRMGDFYELFYEDAITAARELEITLTSRGKGEKRAPLAGVPHHALETYLGRLVKKGYKVAIVEQLEDPKKAKGLVKRGLVRIVTPGTVIESSLLDEKENNYVMAITTYDTTFAIACCDMSTGEFFSTILASQQAMLNELIRLQPSECIIPHSLQVNTELVAKLRSTGCFLHAYDDDFFKSAKKTLLSHFSLSSLESFGMEDKPVHTAVAGALLSYLIDTQKNSLSHIKQLSVRSNQHHMLLDATTFNNLELVKNIKDGSTHGTLLAIMDKTVTAMGARLLKKWMKAPLLQQHLLKARFSAVSTLKQEVILREELITLLKDVFDIERLIGKINYGTASPREVLALRNSLQHVPQIKEKLQYADAALLASVNTLPELEETTRLITQAIREEAPITIREGGLIKPGFHEQLDELHAIRRGSKAYLQELEEKERQRTGIANLKIGYTRVFGYFIEVTKRHIHRVPKNYIRKQTKLNAERYITDELKVEEEKILGAQEKIDELEYVLFQNILKTIARETSLIQEVAGKLALLDVLCSFAKVAAQYKYVQPRLINEPVIHIRAGRHPVVEQQGRFIPNDVFLNDGEMMIITGPNMAGKSTVMRQVALIVFMAQLGSFVPADDAVIGIVDRIFTRVGASDSISSGQSTFMVEMQETANILHNATSRSLLILDEIGRGTSTFDGVSIAWSVAEYIAHLVKAKTLFATHYHVLNKLAEKFENINNHTIAVSDRDGEIVFLHKLIAGSTDQSYGIHVAELAGLPTVVVSRAREIQELLEKDDHMVRKMQARKLTDQKSLGEF
jgi:DNA mismatch repair protein MutS